jgi:hypothetical protein
MAGDVQRNDLLSGAVGVRGGVHGAGAKMTPAQTKKLVSDLMTLYNAGAESALREAGVPQEIINHIFLQVPHFSSVRLAKCKKLADELQKGKPK